MYLLFDVLKFKIAEFSDNDLSILISVPKCIDSIYTDLGGLVV